MQVRYGVLPTPNEIGVGARPFVPTAGGTEEHAAPWRLVLQERPSLMSFQTASGILKFKFRASVRSGPEYCRSCIYELSEAGVQSPGTLPIKYAASAATKAEAIA